MNKKGEWAWEEISKFLIVLIFLILLILLVILFKDKLSSSLESFKNLIGLA